MKKALIAGAASVAMAAMPVMGVFAADGTKTFTDTITVTVDTACGIYSAYTDTTTNTPVVDHSYSKTMTNGQLWNLENDSNFGGSYIGVCNDTTGWDLMAVGAGTGSSVAHMDASTEATDDIATNATITSGDTGAWAFKIANANSVFTNAASSYTAVPTGDGLKVLTTSAATDASTGDFKTGYQVYIGTKTPAGTYTGKVKYTMVHPAAASN